MHERHLASLYELQNVYCTEDVYDFLELIEVQSALLEQASKNAENK